MKINSALFETRLRGFCLCSREWNSPYLRLLFIGENAYIYAGLARVYQDKNDVNQVIKFYRKSIGGLEQVRANIQGLPPQLQTSFLQATIDFDKFKTSDIYRQLAVLLLQQGQVEESLQVKQLGGIQELREAIVLSETEKKIIAQYGSLICLYAIANERECSFTRVMEA